MLSLDPRNLVSKRRGVYLSTMLGIASYNLISINFYIVLQLISCDILFIFLVLFNYDWYHTLVNLICLLHVYHLKQANVAADKENEQNTGINSSTNHDSPVIGQHNIQNGIASTEILHELQESSTAQDDASDSVTLPTNKEHEEQDMSLNVAHDMQVNGDMSSGWKMVLHEESNQYYYWNTLTGETSWNIPDVFAEMTSEVKNNNDAKGTENAVVGMHESNSSLGVNPEVPADTQPAVGMVNDGNCKIEEMPNLSKHLKVSYEDPSAMPKDSCALHQESCSPEKLESKCSAAGACAGNMQNLVVPGEHESGTDLCSHILRRGEFLLERLNTLKG